MPDVVHIKASYVSIPGVVHVYVRRRTCLSRSIVGWASQQTAATPYCSTSNHSIGLPTRATQAQVTIKSLQGYGNAYVTSTI
jgi:hypothetical protein